MRLLPLLGEGGDGGLCFLLVRCACAEGGSRVSARQPTPFLLRRQKKWGKEKASLQAACPAKLTALLRRSVQTAAGNLNFYMEARQSCGWRAG